MSRGSPFLLVREGRAKILADPGFLNTLKEMGIGRVGEILEKAPIDPDRGGREGIRTFCPSGQLEHRYVIRHYARGGFLLGSRPFREMEVTAEIRKRRIPTAQVLAAIRRSVAGPFYEGELITEEIAGARDLASFFLNLHSPLSEAEVRLRHEVTRVAGHTVRLMHDQGVFHGDLNLKNLLFRVEDQTTPEIHIIDFDRSRIGRSLSTRDRMKNLLRLHRSAEKWRAQGASIRYTDEARFFGAYAEGNPDIVRAVRRRLRRIRRHMFWYRLGWRIDRLINPRGPRSNLPEPLSAPPPFPRRNGRPQE
jgi:tRNA A-37 threonylcarbamoyl transferase component Bud32